VKCPSCQQEVKGKPIYLDALGRGFDVMSVLLLARPLYGVNVRGITVTSLDPIGYGHVVVVPDRMESDGRQWVLYGRELRNPNNFVTINGICWEKNLDGNNKILS